MQIWTGLHYPHANVHIRTPRNYIRISQTLCNQPACLHVCLCVVCVFLLWALQTDLLERQSLTAKFFADFFFLLFKRTAPWNLRDSALTSRGSNGWSIRKLKSRGQEFVSQRSLRTLLHMAAVGVSVLSEGCAKQCPMPWLAVENADRENPVCDTAWLEVRF